MSTPHSHIPHSTRPHSPHSSLPTLHTAHTPNGPHSTQPTLHTQPTLLTAHTPHDPHSTQPTLHTAHTPHSPHHTPHSPHYTLPGQTLFKPISQLFTSVHRPQCDELTRGASLHLAKPTMSVTQRSARTHPKRKCGSTPTTFLAAVGILLTP